MQYAEGGAFLAMAGRARKYYLGLVTITQDVADSSMPTTAGTCSRTRRSSCS